MKQKSHLKVIVLMEGQLDSKVCARAAKLKIILISLDQLKDIGRTRLIKPKVNFNLFNLYFVRNFKVFFN